MRKRNLGSGRRRFRGITGRAYTSGLLFVPSPRGFARLSAHCSGTGRSLHKRNNHYASIPFSIDGADASQKNNQCCRQNVQKH